MQQEGMRAWDNGNCPQLFHIDFCRDHHWLHLTGILADPSPLPYAHALPANDAHVPQSGPCVSTPPSMQTSAPTLLSKDSSCAFQIPSRAALTLDRLHGAPLPLCLLATFLLHHLL